MVSFSSIITLFVLTNSIAAENWSTYPKVSKTASINGFADPIKTQLPVCAASCPDLSTGNTPCPYWDTGCLCIMPQWAGQVAQCIADSCAGSDVVSATSLAYSLCSSVGANLWMMPASVSLALSLAAGNAKATEGSSAVSHGSITSTQLSVSQPSSESASTKSSVLASGTTYSLTSQTATSSQLGSGTNSISKFLFLIFLPVFSVMA